MLGYFGIYISNLASHLGSETSRTGKRSVFKAWLPHEIAALNAQHGRPEWLTKALGKIASRQRRKIDISDRSHQKASSLNASL